MNRVILEGIIDSEPEVRYFAHQHLRLDFILYTEEYIQLEKPLKLYHHIVIWSTDLAKDAEMKLHKGQRVHLEGRITYDRYAQGDGSRRVMLVKCESLSILEDIPVMEEQTLAPVVEIDWAEFSPNSNEDPMA